MEMKLRGDLVIAHLKHYFHTLSLVILSLLLPLSFLLFTRIAAQPNLPSPVHQSLHFPFLHLFTAVVCAATLLKSITGCSFSLPTWLVWALLCLFQICTFLAVCRIITDFETQRRPQVTWFQNMILFIGLYDTMTVWIIMFVKPVVDETIFGMDVKESCASKVAVFVAFSAVWLWMLQDEIVPAIYREMTGRSASGWRGPDESIFWMVSHMTVWVGAIKAIHGFVWSVMHLCSHMVTEEMSSLPP